MKQRRKPASMGPRLFSRGKAEDRSARRIAETDASMGPRLFSRGKAHSPVKGQKTPEKCFNGAAAFQPRKDPEHKRMWLDLCVLQWGRGFSAAESGSPRLTHEPAGRLLQWGRGFSAAESSLPTLTLLQEVALQWGRGFSAAESAAGSRQSPGYIASLQWGRGFSAAERCDAVRGCIRRRTASMGPRLFSRGKWAASEDC